MDNLEKNLIVEFIKQINSDNFLNAENVLKSVIEEKIKKRMKKEMKKPDADGDGVPDWADKHHGKDDNALKKGHKQHKNKAKGKKG